MNGAGLLTIERNGLTNEGVGRIASSPTMTEVDETHSVRFKYQV